MSNFLDAISQIESSGGQNMNHPIVQGGIQSGEKAMGSYGLMPNTIDELNNRARLQGRPQPEPSRGPASVQDNPELQKQYANQLADKVLNRFQDPAMAAYAWNQGHNLTPQQVKDRDYLNHPYVQKFQKIWKALGK